MVAALGDIRTLADDCCGQGASTLGPAKASGGVGGTSDPDVGASLEELLGEAKALLGRGVCKSVENKSQMCYWFYSQYKPNDDVGAIVICCYLSPSCVFEPHCGQMAS